MPAPLFSASQPPFFALKDKRFCTASFSFGHLYGAQYFCWPALWRVASRRRVDSVSVAPSPCVRHPARGISRWSSTKHRAKVLLSRGEHGERHQWQEANLLSRGESG